MNLLFVDHSFHAKTNSTKFLQDILSSFFSVSTLYVDPENSLADLDQQVPPATDIIVILQMDYLAPAFLAMGLRVVVVPMYDGSANMPDLHWVLCKEARFVNFSHHLHVGISRCGCESMLVKYFLPPVHRKEIKDFTTLKVFFWQRRPDQGIHLQLVERLLGNQLESIHIHDSPDDPNVDSSPYLIETLPDVTYTKSTWLKKKSNYYDLLDQCNIFIAPRLSEGIGMATLEAMARGMVVLAADFPTNNEYISNWVNGILFNPDHVGEVNLQGRCTSLGLMAWQTAQVGHTQWLASIPSLVEFIRATPPPSRPRIDKMPTWVSTLVNHYFEGMDAYGAFLERNLPAIQTFTCTRAPIVVNAHGRYEPDARPARPTGQYTPGTRNFPLVNENRISFMKAESVGFVLEGNVRLKNSGLLLLGAGVTVGFSINPSTGTTDFMRVKYQVADGLAPDLRYVFLLNGVVIGNGDIGAGDDDIRLRLPLETLRTENVLRVQIFPAGDLGERQTMSQVVSLREIAFE